VPLRASRAACAFFVACDTLPIRAGETLVGHRSFGDGRMPSPTVSPIARRGGNEAARRMASARRAASMCGPRCKLLHVADLLAHAFERCGEHLLALHGGARRCRKSWRLLSAYCTAILARERPLLVAHVAQALTQRLEVVKRGVIDFGMVTAQDHLLLVVLRMLRSNLQSMDMAAFSIPCRSRRQLVR
jgi:hypothetical protein